jgi:hypothetical protein
MERRSAVQQYKRPRFPGLALVAALSSPALQAQDPEAWEVPVYEQHDGSVPNVTIQRAKLVASEILAKAAVKIIWQFGSPTETHDPAPAPCGDSNRAPVSISVDFNRPRGLALRSIETLAYTFPYAKGGPRIHVLYDHMSPTYRNSPRLSGVLLGYILAHEITHVLQRIDRHSNSGVMKARWTVSDYGSMENATLRLAEEDVLLIRLGLESWRRLECSNTVAPAPTITAHAEWS